MKPNTRCANCKKEIYRKPYLLRHYENSYCSQKCAQEARRAEDIQCTVCKKIFHPKSKKQKVCSKSCSNRGRAGISYNKKGSPGRFYGHKLKGLKKELDFDCCMVKGCRYDRALEVHRLIEGKEGGKYEVGNAFAICPNHHAEITRGWIEVEKIDDKTLKIIKWRKPKSKKRCDCGNWIARESKMCKSCASRSQGTKIDWPSIAKLRSLVEQHSFVAVGKMLGVSDNAVRKRLKYHG